MLVLNRPHRLTHAMVSAVVMIVQISTSNQSTYVLAALTFCICRNNLNRESETRKSKFGNVIQSVMKNWVFFVQLFIDN